MRRLRSLLVLAGLIALVACSSKPSAPEPPPRVAPPPQQPSNPLDRARMHTNLAVGYYERGQMDVAIEELNVAVSLDPGAATDRSDT